MKKIVKKFKNLVAMLMMVLFLFNICAYSYAENSMGTDNYSFTIASDESAPMVGSCIPSSGATNVSRSSNIQFCITDDVSGVDSSTIDLSVEGVAIVVNGVAQTYVDAQGQNVAYAVEIVEKNSREVVVAYDPTEYFTYEDEITLSITAADNDGNTLTNTSYSFKVQEFVVGAFSSFSGLSALNVASGAQSVTATPAQDNSCVAANQSGKNVYVAWEYRASDGQWNVYLAKSTDFAKTFTTVLQVNPQEANIDHRYPAIAVDGSDNVYVAWQQQASGADWDIYIAKLDDAETAFSDSYRVYNDSGLSDQLKPSITTGAALTGDGNNLTEEPATVYISWIDDNATTQVVNYLRTTANYSDNWNAFTATPIRVDDDRWPQVCADSVIDVDNDGDIYLAWRGVNNDSTSSIYFDKANRTTTDNGENFGTDVVVSNATASGQGPKLRISSNGNSVFVVWKRLDASNAYLQLYKYLYSIPQSRYNLNAQAQVNSSALTEATLNEYSLALNANNDAFVVWSEERNGNCLINMAGATSTSGYSFEEYTQFSTAGNQCRPNMAIDKNGYHFFISWTDDSNGYDAIMFCRNTFIITDAITTQSVDNDTGGSVTATEGNIVGAKVEIDPDAMEAPMEITVAEVVAPPADSDGMSSVGSVVDFGPGGTIFESPATITIPYTEANMNVAGINDEATLRIYYYNLGTAEWEIVSGSSVDTSNNTVSVGTGHFSMYVVGSVPAGAASTSGSGGGGGGGCFIATASFGTKMATEVRILCEFRDRYLLTNKLGTKFVKFYYRHSPPIANYIRQKEGLRRVIRLSLRPLISFSRALCK